MIVKCDICNRAAALSGSNELHPLVTQTRAGLKGRAPRVYRKDICDDCVTLFNTQNWAKTRKVLQRMTFERRMGKW